MEKKDDIGYKISLPQLYRAGVRRKRLQSVAVIAAAVLLLLAVVWLGTVLTADRERADIEAVLPEGSEEEWRGAFEEREIYNACLMCSVSLKVGRGQSTQYRSGVVLSGNGWIATDAGFARDLPDGRISVRLSDGREYTVEGIIQSEDSSAALLKISAYGLHSAEQADRTLQGGEELIAVSMASDILKGSAMNTDGELKPNILASDESCGAPIFDRSGGLVGMLTEGEYACTAEEIDRLFQGVKNK